jgi:ribosome-associated toxin RatA of RatAB toxin-antitoxin module
MKTVNKSVLIWYSPEEMYALVTDIASYPQFLPWCDRSRVIESHEGGATAEVGIAFGGISQSFTTRNTHVSGREVGIELVNGPFSHLDGRWQFHPVGDGTQRLSLIHI